jgi:putative ABC transport system ATP-binding protein
VDQSLAQFGLDGRGDHRPAHLSGGEQQRGGLAAVLAARPAVLLADEVTGELDRASSAQLLDVLAAARAELNLTVVLATHDPDVAARADRIVHLRDGQVDGEIAA